MSRIKSLMLLLGSGFATWLVYYWAAVYFDSQMPIFMASMILTSVLIHEFGHWVAMEMNGVRAHVFIAVIVGGTVPEDESRMKSLSWAKQSVITLAGPAGSLLVVALAVIMNYAGMLDDLSMSRIANANGALLLFNLIPIGPLDGGRFAKLLFDSVPEQKDWLYALTIVWSVLAVILFVSTVSTESYFFSALLVLWSTKKQSLKDDPCGSSNKKAMTTAECQIATAIFLALIGMGIMLEATSLSWPA